MMPPGLTRYIEFMSTLSEARLSELPEIVTDDMSFQDPFNNLRGREAFARCLHEMLGQLADLKITVTHVGELLDPSGDGAARYVLRWTFGGRLTKLGNRPWQVTGMSEVTLAADGRVNSHIDYWDAAQGLYEKLPLVGGLLRWLRRQLAVRGVTQH
jgi:steroid delta-isomerase